jgi:hypothetical protein
VRINYSDGKSLWTNFREKKRKCFGGKIFEEQFLKEFLNKKLWETFKNKKFVKNLNEPLKKWKRKKITCRPPSPASPTWELRAAVRRSAAQPRATTTWCRTSPPHPGGLTDAHRPRTAAKWWQSSPLMPHFTEERAGCHRPCVAAPWLGRRPPAMGRRPPASAPLFPSEVRSGSAREREEREKEWEAPLVVASAHVGGRGVSCILWTLVIVSLPYYRLLFNSTLRYKTL